MGGPKYLSPETNEAFDQDSNDDSLEDGPMFQDSVPQSEPTESRWIWMIVVALAVGKMAFWGVLPCFGFVFADVLSARPGQEGTSVAAILGAFNIALDIASICSPAFYKRFSYRQVGTTGGVIYFAGTLAAAFSDSVTQLVVTYGVLQGVGFGLMMNASLSSFTQRVARARRTQAMALAQCGAGAGALALPLGAQALREARGVRATKVAFAAISALAAAAQLLLPPSPPQDEDESEDFTKCRIPSHAEYNGDKRACWRGLPARAWRLTGLQARVVRDPLVLLVAFGVALVHMLESSLIAMLPLYLRTLADEVGVARAMTSFTAGDFAGRVLLLVIGGWVGRWNRVICGLASLVAAVAVLGLALARAWVAVVALAAVLGVTKGALYVTLFLALAEVVAPSDFPSAAAMAFAAQILCSFTLAPAVGAVRDVTGSFRVCFGVVAALLAVTPLLWALHAAIAPAAARLRLGRRLAASHDEL